MATFQHCEDIEAWQEVRILTRQVYQATADSRFRRDYALRDQIRRAAISVLANIAEGFEPDGNAEFHHFLSIAKGSAGETRALLIVALDAEYVSDETYTSLHSKAVSVSRQIYGLMRYVRSNDRRGPKFE